MTTITRVTSRNRAAIESDARAGFPDDTAIDLTASGALLVNSGLFAGSYRVVRVATKPRWIGDNGYIFERDTDFGTMTINTAYDLTGCQTSTEARVRHFLRLVEAFQLDADLLASGLATIDACRTLDELRGIASAVDCLMSGAAVRAFTEAIEAREALFAKLATLTSAKTIQISFSGEVFRIEDVADLSENSDQRTPMIIAQNIADDSAAGVAYFAKNDRGWYFSGAGRSFLIEDRAKLLTLDRILRELDRRFAERQSEPAKIATAKKTAQWLYRCQRCGALHFSSVPVDSIYCTCAWRSIEVETVYGPPIDAAIGDPPADEPAAPIDYDPIFAAASSEAASGPQAGSIEHGLSLLNFGDDAAIDFIDNRMRAGSVYDLAMSLRCRIDGAEIVAALRAFKAKTDAAPAEHASRQRVIDRALETNRKYTDDQVEQYPLLRDVALDYVRTYRGENTYVQDIAVKLVDYGTLSAPQMRGALNVMVAEARFERAEAAKRRTSANDFHIDLRRQTDRDIEAAGEAVPPADERANEVAPAIPNGYYTVIIDAAGTYRTLRVGDCPDHFTVKAGTQLISFLSGADNTHDYTGFAFLAGRKVSIWSKFKTADALRQAADLLVADPMTGASEYVKRSNRCFVCNRPLTTPESIARGIGPICAGIVGSMGYEFVDTRSADKRERTSGAEAALKRARERQAASGPISADQARAEMDELFS